MFEFTPGALIDAVPPIPTHALVALAVAAIGTWQLIGAKGTRRHRITGWLFVLGLGYVAVSGLFISTLKIWGPFSPIHLLIPVTLFSLWQGVRDARRGNIKGHARGMVILFVTAIVVTGAFTLLPGRIMHETLFGAYSGGVER